jgi:hypothetical protein
VLWDPVAGRLERNRLDGIDAAVHLGGESLLGLWTPAKKQRMRRSRVVATEFLAESLAGLPRKPRVFLCASAVGFYGGSDPAWKNERSPAGSGYLAELCTEWEAAADLAARAGIRTCRLRLGLVLSPHGGMLGRMLPVFRAGLGGKLGHGRQHMSWIALHDLLRAVEFLLGADRISGPVNVVAPNPVTNREFTRALARALQRPAIFPVPGFLLRLLPGGMAAETFLADQRVEPAVLNEAGFQFDYPELDGALRRLV